MASLTSRALYLAALATCAAAALRPRSSPERALELMLSPLRALSEVAAPVGLLRARSVRAAERRMAALRDDEVRERRELGADQRRFVLPRDPALREGRSFVIAEAIGRARDDVDRLLVSSFGAPDEERRLAAGLPVVVGGHYIGRIHDVAPDGSRASVDLVTRRNGFVGARVLATRSDETDGAAAVRAVVGGLARHGGRPDRRFLSLSAPASRSFGEGARVVVDESLAGNEPFAALADGFELGWLEPLGDPREERTWGVRSPIDFLTGIYQVAIVTPRRAAGERPERDEHDDALEDGRWLRARALSAGDPTGLHEGLVLGAGSLRGVRHGAALVSGARLVGRVDSVGLFSCGGRLLGDPGLLIPAVARVAGSEQPLILGTLVVLGRPAGARGAGLVRLHWEEGWPEQGGPLGAERVEARLFTGAGAFGVPPGLVLGDTWLACSPGHQVLELELDVDPRELSRFDVRIDEPGARAPLEESP